MGEVYSHSAEGEHQLSALRSQNLSTLPPKGSTQTSLIPHSDFSLPPPKNETLPFTTNGIPSYTGAEKAKRLIDSGKALLHGVLRKESMSDCLLPHTKELTPAVWVQEAKSEAKGSADVIS